MAEIKRGKISFARIVAKSRQVAIQSQSWVTENLFGVQGVVHVAPPDTTSVLRAPVRTPIFRRPAFAQTVFATNLLLTTLAAVPVSVTPATATLTTTAYAATVTASDHKTVTPTTAGLTLTTYAPTVTAIASAPFVPIDWQAPTRRLRQVVPYSHRHAAYPDAANQTVTPTTATLTTTAYAPTVTASGNQSVTPSTASLTTALYAPTVTASNHQSVTPTTATLTATTYAPSVTATGGAMPMASGDWPNPIRRIRQVIPYSHRYAGSPVSTTLATPATAALTLTTYAPTVTAGAVVYPFANTDWPNPRINPKYRQFLNSGRVLGEEPFPFTQTEWPNPNRRVLAKPTFTQSRAYTLVQGSVSVTPTTASLVLTTYAPTVTAIGGQTVTPTTATLTTSAYAPTVTATSHQSVTPTTATLTTTAYAPTVTTPRLVTPTTAALTTTRYAPTVTVESASKLVTPTTAALVLTTYAPDVNNGAGRWGLWQRRRRR